jgi:hypothetical protein
VSSLLNFSKYVDKDAFGILLHVYTSLALPNKSNWKCKCRDCKIIYIKSSVKFIWCIKWIQMHTNKPLLKRMAVSRAQLHPNSTQFVKYFSYMCFKIFSVGNLKTNIEEIDYCTNAWYLGRAIVSILYYQINSLSYFPAPC